MSKKLPLLKIIIGAFTFTWFYKSVFMRNLIWPITGMIIIRLLWMYVDVDWSIRFFWVTYFLHCIFFAFFAITCHRTVLLGEGSVSEYGFYKWTQWEVRFFGLLILLYVILKFVVSLSVEYVLSFFTSFNPENNESYYFLLDFFINIPLFYLFSRFSLVFPATATKKQYTLNQSWNETRGNGLRAAIAVGYFPLCINFLVGLLWRENPTLMEIIAVFMFHYFAYIVAIAALSLSYKEFQNMQGTQ